MLRIKFDKKFISLIASIAIDAGKKIILESNKKKIEFKSDGSPVTAGDKAANDHITKSLMSYNPEIPILSEESSPNSSILESNILWAIDPLDGTKEFISNSPDFTVNIALIKKKYPIFGVIYAPVTDVLWLGFHDRSNLKESKAYKLLKASRGIKYSNPNWKKISVNKTNTVITVMTSKSHRSNKLDDWITSNYKIQDIEIIEKGSSLKICFVADGSAHLYPRFGRTCVWRDTVEKGGR